MIAKSRSYTSEISVIIDPEIVILSGFIFTPNTCMNLAESSDCSLKDQKKIPATLKLPFSLESLLSITADKNKTVALTVAGYSYKDMLMSWVCRLRELSIENFVVCALDQETYQFSILQGIPFFTDPIAPSNISFYDCHFGTKCFQRVTKVKSRIVLKILKLGYNILLSDVDVYWFRNPVPLLHSYGPAVLVTQSDEYQKQGAINVPRRLNFGLYYAHSDTETIAAIEKVVRHAETSGLSEQPISTTHYAGKEAPTVSETTNVWSLKQT
ncbi:hypothetical protein Fmac_005678 [Flemingia macrophylla]|uniref:Nucleotide-diphospho-sugar transferase domain-containing protein n=1 Tax=Flemingia macrophylla TaxID=520843 RepID=A0ABD1N8U5_9FABA